MAKQSNNAAQSPQEKKIEQQKKRSARFKTVAAKRMNKALAAIANVGACSNRRSYAFDGSQVDKITAALETAVANVKKNFANTDEKPRGSFEL